MDTFAPFALISEQKLDAMGCHSWALISPEQHSENDRISRCFTFSTPPSSSPSRCQFVWAFLVLFTFALSSRPSRMIRFANHPARGGTCCLPAVPAPPAGSRSLDCEACPLRGRASSLGMTDFVNFSTDLLLRFILLPLVPFRREVFPSRVLHRYQPVFLHPTPAL